MRITILTHLEREGTKSHDQVVDQIAAALRQIGHQPSVLGVHGDAKKLIGGLARRRPDLVFNVMETFGDGELGAVSVASLLQLLDLHFTGGGPGEIYLQEDKSLTKKLLAFEGIRFPDFAVFSQDAGLETGGNLHFPLFVKPLRMDASIGIDSSSLVRSTPEMWKQVALIHEKVKDAALAEEYIEGREFYIGILGNQNPTVFPPVEIDFSRLPADKPHIVDAKAKWDKDSPEFQGTEVMLPAIPDQLRARLQKAALGAYRALRVRDYGRIDLRLAETGELYVIEVNASCYLERSSEFAHAAAAAGIDYPALIGRIVDEAVSRFKHPTAGRRPQHRRKVMDRANAAP